MKLESKREKSRSRNCIGNYCPLDGKDSYGYINNKLYHFLIVIILSVVNAAGTIWSHHDMEALFRILVFCQESTHRWIPLSHRAINWELWWLLYCRPVEQTVKLTVIWDAMIRISWWSNIADDWDKRRRRRTLHSYSYNDEKTMLIIEYICIVKYSMYFVQWVY